MAGLFLFRKARGSGSPAFYKKRLCTEAKGDIIKRKCVREHSTLRRKRDGSDITADCRRGGGFPGNGGPGAESPGKDPPGCGGADPKACQGDGLSAQPRRESLGNGTQEDQDRRDPSVYRDTVYAAGAGRGKGRQSRSGRLRRNRGDL